VRVLDSVYVICLVAAVVAAPFLVISWFSLLFRRPEKRVFPIKSTVFFAVPVVMGIIAAAASASLARSETLQFLQAVSAKATVSIDGHDAQNSGEILNALRDLRTVAAHHSHPTRMLALTISDPPQHLRLFVARDSETPREYWVLAPSASNLPLRRNATKDIGHVVTSAFDAY
jgi:hypothetical protein